MADPYVITIDGSALVPSFCKSAVMLEGTAAGRVEVHEFAYQDGGDVQLADWQTSPKLSLLRTVLVSGTASQVYQAHHNLSGLLLGGRKVLRRTDPFAGVVEAEVAVVDSTRQKEQVNRLEWDWPLWILPGHFRGITDVVDGASGLGTSGTVASVTPSGTHPTAPVITITNVTAGANPAIGLTTGDQESISVSGSYTAADEVIIDVPNRTVTVNGTRAKNISDPSHAHWIRLQNGVVNTIDFTADSGTWDVDIAYRERWRI